MCSGAQVTRAQSSKQSFPLSVLKSRGAWLLLKVTRAQSRKQSFPLSVLKCRGNWLLLFSVCPWQPFHVPAFGPWGLTACQNHPGWTGNCTWPFSVWLVSVFWSRLWWQYLGYLQVKNLSCQPFQWLVPPPWFRHCRIISIPWRMLFSALFALTRTGISSNSWAYAVGFTWWPFMFILSSIGKNCLAELCGTYVPLIAVPPAPKGTKGSGDGIWSGTLLPLLYKQLTPTKRELLLWENVPQAGFSIIFLLVEGGSLFISFVNLALPAFQVILAFTLFRWVRSAVGPHLGKQLNGAMAANDFLKTRHIWEEAGRHWGWGGNGDSGLGLCHHQLHQF